MKRCPHCGGTVFAVKVPVEQEWKVNGHGEFIEVTEPRGMVIHHPDDYDLWYCWRCGYEAPGSKFNV